MYLSIFIWFWPTQLLRLRSQSKVRFCKLNGSYYRATAHRQRGALNGICTVHQAQARHRPTNTTAPNEYNSSEKLKQLRTHTKKSHKLDHLVYPTNTTAPKHTPKKATSSITLCISAWSAHGTVP
jgi:hypothetical protein